MTKQFHKYLLSIDITKTFVDKIMYVFINSTNIGGIFFVFLIVVTPVFILVLIGYFIGARLKFKACSLSRPAYYVFVLALVFNIISKTQIEAEFAF